MKSSNHLKDNGVHRAGHALEELLSAAAIRERSAEILEAGLENRLDHFRIDLGKLPSTAVFVTETIREKYPDLNVPLHSRWRHFQLGGRDLWRTIESRTDWPDRRAKARSACDLAIISVLLDAGAGPAWTYRDPAIGLAVGRSEGLALASFRMFEAGDFSSDPKFPLRADADRMATFTSVDLARGFQSDETNPLAGLEGRAALIARLGRILQENQKVFALSDKPRPGGIFDYLASAAGGQAIEAAEILKVLLSQFGPVWPGRIQIDGTPLGDTWFHPAIRRSDETDRLVPLHKLSQWLAYSLIEPLREAGVDVQNLDGLTGLAEYRNGGLFIDLDVLVLRDPAALTREHRADNELIVEWRALTVALLDLLAPVIRGNLGVTAANFPLGCILEGGTWSAGRKAARLKRSDGRPPLTVISDGTVF